SPDGRWVAAVWATAGVSSRLVVWDTSTGRKVASLRGPQDDTVYLTFSPDGTTLVVGCNDDSVWLTDWPAVRLVRILIPPPGGSRTGFSFQAIFSPDGRHLVACARGVPVGQPGGELLVYDVPVGRTMYRVEGTGAVVSPDGKTLFVSGARG